MRFIFQYPDVGPDRDMLDPGAITEVARAAEAAGFDGFSLTEHPVPSAKWLANGGHQSLDPFVAMANAAAVTERLRFVTFLSVVPYRNPSLLAKSAATVDKLSGGRFVLGAGVGYLRSEFAALGVDFEERNVLFDEALDVLPLHWSGEPFSYEGRHFTVREAVGRPVPVQQPIPIWIGGNSTKAMERAATKAQGWMPMLAPPVVAATARTPAIEGVEELAVRIDKVRELAGDRAGSLDVVASYSDRAIGEPTADSERHREAFAHLESIGVTWVVVSCPTDSWSATSDFLAAFGETYLPAG